MNAAPLRYLVLFLALGCARPAAADTVTIAASQDTTIFQNEVDNSDGGGPALFSGTNGSVSPRRALLSFNVAGALPPGATITNVQLTLTLAQVAGSGGGSGGGGGGEPHVIRLYAATQAWGEGTAGSGSTVMMSGGGFAANPGDATWNACFYSPTAPTLWNTPGGDFVSTASSSLSVSGTTVGTAYTWPSTAQLVTDVQTWYNNPASNFGWILKNDDETTAQTYYAFYSREWTGPAGTLPQLTITYSVPEPQVAGLLAAAALWGLSRWRRRA